MSGGSPQNHHKTHIGQFGEKQSRTGPIVLGVVVTLLAVGGFLWMNESSKKSVVTEMLVSAEKDAISTRPGQGGNLTLGDGSTAQLAPESRLVVVADFGKKYRAARASGGVALTIAEGNETPMEIRVGDNSVTGSSGTIAVRDYANEPETVIRVEGGDAQLQSRTSSRALSSGQTVIIDAEGSIRDASESEATVAMAWVDRRIILYDVTVADALKQFQRWYFLDIRLAADSLGERVVSIDAPLDSSRVAIIAIEDGANLRQVWNEKQMILEAVAPRRGR